MKKIKHFLLLTVCFGLFMQVNAAPVDRAIAKKVAIAYCTHKTSFFKQNLSTSSVTDEHTLFFSGKPALYVFNFDEGFVVTTTDDRAPAIIAYAPQGSFNVAKIPAPAKMWLAPIEEYVANLQIENPKAGTHPEWIELQSDHIANSAPLSKGVTPLTTSKWGQAQGYNDSCPVIASGPGGRCVTGCVATAMSQIMYYHKYPQFGNGFNSYSHIYYGEISQNFNGVEYFWNNMADIAGTTSRADISKLIYHVGVSVNMNYGPQASGTASQYATNALQNNFRYRSDIRSIDRLNFTLLNWQRVMKDNLDAHQPVLYSGTDDTTTNAGGHAWVCDGYNDNNKFHMNWGWDGAADGYYFLDTLKAVIGTTMQGRFNASQSAVVNIAPLNHEFCYETRIFHEPNFTITDGSGLSPYKNNSDCHTLIDLDTMGINLTFTYFNTQADHDFLKIYKGDVVDPLNLLATYSGISTPAPIILPQGQGGKLLLVFTSDTTVQGEGWTATCEGVYQGVTNYTKENNVRLYPNPATDNVLITVPELSNANTTVSYFDLTGRMVFQAPAQFSNAGNAFVNVSTLTSGIYIMKIESAKTTFSTKLIKK